MIEGILNYVGTSWPEITLMFLGFISIYYLLSKSINLNSNVNEKVLNVVDRLEKTVNNHETRIEKLYSENDKLRAEVNKLSLDILKYKNFINTYIKNNNKRKLPSKKTQKVQEEAI